MLDEAETIGSRTSKERGNYPVSECIRYECVNRGAACDYCWRFSEYKEEVDQ